MRKSQIFGTMREQKELSDDKNKSTRKTENLTSRAYTFIPETNDRMGNIKRKKSHLKTQLVFIICSGNSRPKLRQAFGRCP